MKEKVLAVLDEIRPGLMADGGNVDLVDVSPDGVV
ncbi:MAG: NifU family protein, partial [Candidatus Desantisbacteria bacterium]